MATRIYVGNLPYSATDQQLGELFAPYGEVTEATVVTDRGTGQSKGFGFVQMTSDDAARSAIAGLDGSSWQERSLRVSEAQAREDRPRRDDNRGRRDDSSRDRRW